MVTAPTLEISPARAREARFAEFVAEHRERAVGLAWKLMSGDADAAEDVAQEAFVKAWRALPGFREEARLSTWFYRILVRQAHSHRRWLKVKRMVGLSGLEQSVDTFRDSGLGRRITKGLDQLSTGQREVFVLVHLEGFTVKEAAELLGKAEGTCKSHLHRALKAMRSELDDLWEASPPPQSPGRLK